MLTDLVIDPFGADVADMVELAVVAERAGFDGVWTFDHVSGAVADRGWSRDPFVVLGAVAARTERVRLGVLVANVVNRHPAQLASAASALQSLAPGRVVCGMGSGAAPSSVYAVEQSMLGRTIGPADERCQRLIEHVGAVRAIWAGARTGVPVDADGTYVAMRGLTGVVSPDADPPIVIGSSGERTVRVAAEIADGVNIRRTPRLAELVGVVDDVRGSDRSGFEVSLFERLDPAHPLGGEVDELNSLGIGARTLLVSPPFSVDLVAAVRAVGSASRVEFGRSGG